MEQLNFIDYMMNVTDDITFNKHQGNEQSNEANKKVNKQADRNKIICYLEKNGNGYSKQIARYMDKQLNQISGRITELKIDGIIEPVLVNGIKVIIDGCQVYRLRRKN